MAQHEFRSEEPLVLSRASGMESWSLDSAKQVRTPPHGRIEVVDVGDATIGRTRFEPGWKWSRDVKPIAKTASCQLLHRLYMVSGHMRVRMDDGTELDLGPGEAAYIPPGHDAWVVGDEAVENISFSHAAHASDREDPSKD